MIAEGVREYAEGLPVEIEEIDGRPRIVALNEAGCNGTQVDLLGLLAWLRWHRPDIMEAA